jgi:membrane carboxypeptidase/penicillin-binding protein PbpC
MFLSEILPWVAQDSRSERKQTMSPGKKQKFTIFQILLAIPAMLGIALILAIAHYILEVHVARLQTPSLIAAVKDHYGMPLTLSVLTAKWREMILAVEDPTFMRHHGVDLETPGAGMTTITQGLVKLIYFPNGFHPGIAKIRQTLIAQYALDSLVSKDDQLLLFLNIVYLGHKDGKAVHGFENAARTYFGKEFTALTDEEFLSLTAMFIGPNTFKPGTPAHDERMQRINAYLSGEYRPAGLLDVEYNGKRYGTPAEELLVALLKIITNAHPKRAG